MYIYIYIYIYIHTYIYIYIYIYGPASGQALICKERDSPQARAHPRNSAPGRS